MLSHIPLSIDFSGDAILNIIGQGQDIGSIADNVLRSAVDFGLSFAQNVSSAIPRFAHVSSKSSPEFKHSQLQKSRNDVPELSDASLVSAFAAKLLKKGTNNISFVFLFRSLKKLTKKTC